MVDIQIGAEGITPDVLTKLSRVPPLPAKTYEFMVDDVTDGNTQEGRPKWTVWLKVMNDPTYPTARLPYNCNLPWMNPSTGAWDVSGGFALVDLMNGTGKTWLGDIRKEDVQTSYKQLLKGATGFMRVGQRANRLDPQVMENTVRIVAAKR